MDPKLRAIAEGALRRLEGAPRHPQPQGAPEVHPVTPPEGSAPERGVFEAILGTVDADPHPCFLEPGEPCQSCSGRCRTLGF